MRCVFLGTPNFAAEVLKYLLQHGMQIVAVISKPDKPVGRSKQILPVPVKVVALENGVPIYQPEKISAPEFFPTLQEMQPDLFVVVAYGEILKQHVLDLPKKGCINLHASLLPKYRGAAPIQQAIIHGENESGVTIMHMVKKMDAGEMIKQEKVQITENMTYGELESALLEVGRQALLEVILEIEKGEITSTLQNENEVTFAPKIELEDCEIDWNKNSQTIHNLVRGVNPEPGAWSYINLANEKKRLKIFKTELNPSTSLKPGDVIFENGKKVIVGCGNSSALTLLEVQPEGKKRMSAADFMRGLPLLSNLFTL